MNLLIHILLISNLIGTIIMWNKYTDKEIFSCQTGLLPLSFILCTFMSVAYIIGLLIYFIVF